MRDRTASPLFARPQRGRPPGRLPGQPPAAPERPAEADCRHLDLTPGRFLRSRVAGLFVFLPRLVQLRFDRLVAQAGSPGSQMVPAVRALLSLLSLKLLDQERRSHINDFNCDEGLGLFAGRNIPPQKSFATDYSYRTPRTHQQRLLSDWVAGWSALLFPQAQDCSVDFHPIPYRGDPTGWDTHSVAMQRTAGPSVLTFFAQEQESGVLCSGNANLTRDDPAGEVLRFVEFWHTLAGHDPQGLDFDSKAAPDPELSRVNRRGIWFVTIRRRGSRLWRRLTALPANAWHRAVIDIPKRRHQNIRFVDETVELPDDEGPIRQLAVTGLGRDQPTLFLSNNREESARNWIKRDAGRKRVEDGLGISVNFFHLDCLASEVRLNVDLDVMLTVLANGCYRWLATQLKGFEKAAPKQLYRTFVETGGLIEIQAKRVLVRLDRRCHNPILREATTHADGQRVPWLQNLPITFEYS